MNHFAVVNQATGEIQYTQHVPEGISLEDYLPGDVEAIELPANAEEVHNFVQRFLWRNGSWALRPEAPEFPSNWDNERWKWVWDKGRHMLQQKREIDASAEIARVRLLTPGAGQAMEYEAVVREAERCLDGKPGRYRMLMADVEAGYADDLREAAEQVLARRDAWEDGASRIRSIRLKGKADLERAASPEEMRAIAAQAVIALKGEHA